jgi:type IX secretion system PorP/SprF family membrane protein
MKNVFIKYLLGSALMLTTTVFSQQLPQYTQYMFNQYAFNPAYAGSKDNWEAISINRYQWLGITDAPRTFTLAANGPLKNEKLAMGGYLYTDIVGPTRRVGFQTSFAYLLKLTEGINLSFGLSVGFNQWILDADKITAYHDDDFYFSNGLLKSFDPDGKFGLYLYHDDWYFGASIEQILHDKLSFLSTQVGSESFLEDHYYFNGGYNIQLSDDWAIEPSFILKYSPPVVPKLDLNVRAAYKKMIWAGIGFRTRDAATVMVGFNHRETLRIGYAFDITTTDLKNYSSGSHEVMLGITFGDSKIR